VRDELDIKLLGLNSGVLATVTLTDIQTILEVVLVTVTILYTAHRYVRFLKSKDNKNGNDKNN
jgi:hypothetical protein